MPGFPARKQKIFCETPAQNTGHRPCSKLNGVSLLAARRTPPLQNGHGLVRFDKDEPTWQRGVRFYLTPRFARRARTQSRWSPSSSHHWQTSRHSRSCASQCLVGSSSPQTCRRHARGPHAFGCGGSYKTSTCVASTGIKLFSGQLSYCLLRLSRTGTSSGGYRYMGIPIERT